MHFCTTQLNRNRLPAQALPSHLEVKDVDDRKLLLEHTLILLLRLSPARRWLPANTFFAEIQTTVIGFFYGALSHPPTTFVPYLDQKNCVD